MASWISCLSTSLENSCQSIHPLWGIPSRSLSFLSRVLGLDAHRIGDSNARSPPSAPSQVALHKYLQYISSQQSAIYPLPSSTQIINAVSFIYKALEVSVISLLFTCILSSLQNVYLHCNQQVPRPPAFRIYSGDCSPDHSLQQCFVHCFHRFSGQIHGSFHRWVPQAWL